MTDLNPVKALKSFQQKLWGKMQWGTHWAVPRSSMLALSIPKKLGNSSQLMSPLQARWEGGKPSVWRIRESCSICPTGEQLAFLSVFSEIPSAFLLCHIPLWSVDSRWVVPFALWGMCSPQSRDSTSGPCWALPASNKPALEFMVSSDTCHLMKSLLSPQGEATTCCSLNPTQTSPF